MPQRKPGSWEFELPPECHERDYTGCSHDALVAMVQCKDGEKLKQAIIRQIEQHGATHNQRALLQLACEWLLAEELAVVDHG